VSGYSEFLRLLYGLTKGGMRKVFALMVGNVGKVRLPIILYFLLGDMKNKGKATPGTGEAGGRKERSYLGLIPFRIGAGKRSGIACLLKGTSNRREVKEGWGGGV